MSQYDVIIIGAGPGGYVSAIRCAQLGMKTALVDGRETLGGTCLNVGCIPSKALLHATHMLHEAEHNFAAMGLKGKSPSVDWKQMKSYKTDVVTQNTGGIEFLLKKNKIDWIKGYASKVAAGKVKVGDTEYDTKNVVIASGSVPSTLPGVKVDNDKGVVVDSTGALDLPKVPKKLTVIGAGVIGLELGSVYARLGAEVTVVEYMDAICSGMDADVQRTFKRILEKQGLKFVMGAAVSSVDTTKTKAKVNYTLKKSPDEEQTLDADVVLVATGRKPFHDGLGLEAAGVKLTKRGQIATDDRWQTNVSGIYAIGDVIEGPMLAHKAEDEGMAVAEVIAGKHGHVNYSLIPGVVYTTPEVATVGTTEAELKAEGKKPKIGKFMFMGNARAKAVHQGDGFVKLIVDKETDRVLGAAIIGPAAGDMIHEICVAMEFGASAQDIAMTCHAHPTYSEAVREAALACGDGAIHA